MLRLFEEGRGVLGGGGGVVRGGGGWGVPGVGGGSCLAADIGGGGGGAPAPCLRTNHYKNVDLSCEQLPCKEDESDKNSCMTGLVVWLF